MDDYDTLYVLASETEETAEQDFTVTDMLYERTANT
jgi:hypothetical protein